MMTGGAFLENNDRIDRNSNLNTFYMNKTNAIDDLSKENVVRHSGSKHGRSKATS